MSENKLIREYEMRHPNTISDSQKVRQSILVMVVDNVELRAELKRRDMGPVTVTLAKRNQIQLEMFLHCRRQAKLNQVLWIGTILKVC